MSDELKATIESSVWCEKYKPATINDLLISDELRKKFDQYMRGTDIPNLLLSGSAGNGKTSSAKIIANHISGWAYRDKPEFEDATKPLFINASSESGVDVVRHTIIPYCVAATMGDSLKVVILDEMEEASERFQTALREVIERFYSTTRFILTCNFLNRVIGPLQSRTQAFVFGDIDRVDIIKRLMGILNAENVKYDKANLIKIVKDNGTDMRKLINILQKLTIIAEDGSKKLEKYSTLDESHNMILEFIKSKNLSDFRKFLIENNPNYDELVYFLFDAAFKKKITENNWVSMVAEIAEIAKNIKLGVNPEITTVNGISQCMKLMG